MFPFSCAWLKMAYRSTYENLLSIDDLGMAKFLVFANSCRGIIKISVSGLSHFLPDAGLDFIYFLIYVICYLNLNFFGIL